MFSVNTETLRQEYVLLDDQLLDLGKVVSKVREEYFEHLDTLPDPLNERAKRHYINRLVRTEGRHMLGEYVPFFLADILRLSYEKVIDLTVPWLTVYHYSLLVDDTLDYRDEFKEED